MGRGLEEARSRACPVLCAVRPSVTRLARQHPRDPEPSPGAAQRFAADALATQRSARPRSTRYWRERPIVTQNAALRGCSGSGVTSAAFVAALRWSAQAAGGTQGAQARSARPPGRPRAGLDPGRRRPVPERRPAPRAASGPASCPPAPRLARGSPCRLSSCTPGVPLCDMAPGGGRCGRRAGAGPGREPSVPKRPGGSRRTSAGPGSATASAQGPD